MARFSSFLTRLLLLSAIVSTLFGAVPGRAASTELLIVHAGGSAYKFEIELATTPDERERGLMFRKSLGANAGMLFMYPDEEPVAFWMKNTLIPLDMLFIKADGHIVHVARNAVPLDETPIASGQPVKAVLEINGGAADALGIKEGDTVEYEGAAGSLGGS